MPNVEGAPNADAVICGVPKALVVGCAVVPNAEAPKGEETAGLDPNVAGAPKGLDAAAGLAAPNALLVSLVLLLTPKALPNAEVPNAGLFADSPCALFAGVLACPNTPGVLPLLALESLTNVDWPKGFSLVAFPKGLLMLVAKLANPKDDAGFSGSGGGIAATFCTVSVID